MPSILIVDDHPALASMLAALVEFNGGRAIVAENGRAALDVLRSQDVSLVILDNNMPEMSGIDVLEAMRSRDDLPKPPVVMFSASDSPRDRALELGASAFVMKPNFEVVETYLRAAA